MIIRHPASAPSYTFLHNSPPPAPPCLLPSLLPAALVHREDQERLAPDQLTITPTGAGRHAGCGMRAVGRCGVVVACMLPGPCCVASCTAYSAACRDSLTRPAEVPRPCRRRVCEAVGAAGHPAWHPGRPDCRSRVSSALVALFSGAPNTSVLSPWLPVLLCCCSPSWHVHTALLCRVSPSSSPTAATSTLQGHPGAAQGRQRPRCARCAGQPAEGAQGHRQCALWIHRRGRLAAAVHPAGRLVPGIRRAELQVWGGGRGAIEALEPQLSALSAGHASSAVPTGPALCLQRCLATN